MLCVTRDLLASGANCLLQNAARETPLHLAAKQGCVATVESLLRTDHGLWSMNTCDAQGLTPLHIAAAHAQAHVVSLLIAKGSSFRRYLLRFSSPSRHVFSFFFLSKVLAIKQEYTQLKYKRKMRISSKTMENGLSCVAII